MKGSYEDAVLKTVMFWSDKSFRTRMNQNNGDNSESGGMAFLLMNMVSSNAQETITEDKIKVFESELTKSLMNCEPYERTLDVDYHPCEMLSNAADKAGINGNCFPCKTLTRINDDNSVDSKYQYGGGFVKL